MSSSRSSIAREYPPSISACTSTRDPQRSRSYASAFQYPRVRKSERKHARIASADVGFVLRAMLERLVSICASSVSPLSTDAKRQKCTADVLEEVNLFRLEEEANGDGVDRGVACKGVG